MNCSIETRLNQINVELSKSSRAHKNTEQYGKTLYDVHSFIAHQLQGLKKGKLLDVGCAYGHLAVLLAEDHHVTGLDNMPELKSDKAFERNKIDFIQANIETDMIEDTYDYILFSEVLEHLCYSPVTTVEKLYKALKPGGSLYLTTPIKGKHPINGRYPYVAHYRDLPPVPLKELYEFEDEHHYMVGGSELQQLLEEVGFKVKDLYAFRKGFHWYCQAIK